MKRTFQDFKLPLLIACPLLIVLWIWLSPLAFVPVPWPDDSAFYFVGREFWKWPPRWVMLPQAPFEPTYRIYNFNTMPLYPMLVGFGRFIGIDGSFAIKLWPLSSFALSASLLGAWLYRAGLPWIAALLFAAGVSLDPSLRWASVLVRPESFVGLCGMTVVLGLTLGFPKRLQARGLWDPLAALLALAAYAHFNAIHLLFPVILAFILTPRRLIQIGLRSLLYLTPWIITVALKPALFVHQMTLQWQRLVFHNDWLDSPTKAITQIFQDMGSPEPWPTSTFWAAAGIWIMMIVAAVFGILLPLTELGIAAYKRRLDQLKPSLLLPAAGWVLGSVWLWYNKPEVWFNFFLHLSVWAFTGVATLSAWKMRGNLRLPALISLMTITLLFTGLYAQIDIAQAQRLGVQTSWHWDTYHDYISCIDQELVHLEKRLGSPKPFHVWCPTFPDITVELSRKHPDWELTRTNDFWDRAGLAIQHGRDVEAVVVAETIGWSDRTISAPASDYPTVQSAWMTWNAHFLNRLWTEKDWKPNRYICQRGRWQAFIFEK